MRPPALSSLLQEKKKKIVFSLHTLNGDFGTVSVTKRSSAAVSPHIRLDYLHL